MGKIITPDFSQSKGSFLDEPGKYNLCRGLRVEYSEALKNYLASKETKDILITSYKPRGHMAFAEEDIQLISEDRADALIASGAHFVLGEVGRVIISSMWIPDARNAVIKLDVQNYLGVKAIKAEGLKRQNLLSPFSPILVPQD